MTNVNSDVQEISGADISRRQLIEPIQISNEIQAWTENFEQKNNDRIMKMREKMENKLDAGEQEIKSNKSASTVTNPRSEIDDTQNMQSSGSKIDRPIGVHASYYPLQACKMKTETSSQTIV